MAVSEAERQEIMDLTGSMSVREIAEHLGISKDAVHRVQKSMRDSPDAVALSVADTATPRTRARARDKPQPVAEVVAVRYETPLHIIGRNTIASMMTDQLVSELELYEKAKRTADVDPQAKWEMVQHQKLIQSALKSLAQWCGLDKGNLPGADDSVENLEEKDIETLSLDDMLKIAGKLI